MRYLTLELHRRLLAATGGASGIRDFGALESAVAQPKATFGGSDLYPTLPEKAAALCLALVQGHPFVDGNKRVGHGAMETFLVLNGHGDKACDRATSYRDLERFAPRHPGEIPAGVLAELSHSDAIHW